MDRLQKHLHIAILAYLTLGNVCLAASEEFERFLQDNITDSPTTSPTVNPTANPVPVVSPPPPPPVEDEGNEGDTLILALGIVGFVLFFGVIGFFVYNMAFASRQVVDTTGGDVLGAGAGYNPTAAPAVKAVSPLESLQAGDRGSVSTIFSTDSHMSVNSGFYSGKVEAEEGKDGNLMSLLKGKREEHNKRKGKKNRPPKNIDTEQVGKKNLNSMQEIADL